MRTGEEKATQTKKEKREVRQSRGRELDAEENARSGAVNRPENMILSRVSVVKKEEGPGSIARGQARRTARQKGRGTGSSS